jgi:hypothetical protein
MAQIHPGGHMRRRLPPLATLALTLALAGAALDGQRPRTAPRPDAGAAEPAPALAKPAPPPAAAREAGALSPRNANYAIEARLDAKRRVVTGREWLTWRNISASPTSELRYHLYYNAFRNSGSTWLRERALVGGFERPLSTLSAGDWGWIDVTAARLVGLDGAPPIDLDDRRFVAPDDGNRDDRTVMVVRLPKPVAPGETLNVYLEWTAQVPRTFARTGGVGDYYFLAQWFPKVGVLEDSGWNCHQFHASTEFFSDYGIYDVKLTVPTSWVVGATGVEREAKENQDGTTTHRFYQEDVHDFAWTTSPRYLVRSARFEQDGLPAVTMRLLLQPEHASQADRYFDATRAALRYYGQWFGPYPFPHITIVDPAWQSGAGGMEYPTLFTGGTRWMAPTGVAEPEGVTVHECGHQFWYALVGNNEFEDAWIDEGFNTFATGRTMALAFNPNYESLRFFGGFVPWVLGDIPLSRAVDENRLSSYRTGAKLDAQSTPSWRYWPAAAGALSYSKTALWLHTLERHLGWSTLQRVMSTFFTRWKFRHPTPQDFFAVANEVTGRDMSWFFDQVHRSSNVFDYAVADLRTEPVAARGYFDNEGRTAYKAEMKLAGKHRSTVVVRRLGEGVFPVDVLVTFKNGEKIRERWDGRDRWKLYAYERGAEVLSAQVDPERVLLLDVNYTNNSRTLEPAASAAATKWTLKWMVWLQDLLLNAAFLV